jgi:hypothetical protein
VSERSKLQSFPLATPASQASAPAPALTNSSSRLLRATASAARGGKATNNSESAVAVASTNQPDSQPSGTS